MKVFGFLILVIIVAALLMEFWPLTIVLLILVLAWKLYEVYYFKSPKFSEIKQRIISYINDCNDLNNHIEELKSTKLLFDKTDYGIASYKDSSKWNYQRKYLKNQKYAPNVYNCSRTVCDNARKKPFEYICKYFGIKANEESLSCFENILNN